MACCDHCTDAESFFTHRAATRELKRYRRRGPTGTTQHLVDMLRAQALRERTLLDIGGGIGVIQHELMGSGVARAIHVDASRGYLSASQTEAARRGTRERVEYHFGDFVDIAAELPDADIVTLDRVVCCYPDMPALVHASASKARELYALSFPRVHGITRIGRRAANLWFRMSRSSFRTFLHPPHEIAAEIERHGFREIAAQRGFMWHAVLYRRVVASGTAAGG